MTNSTEFEAVDIDVEDWIGGTSFLQAKHTIYRNPAMYAEYQPILARIDELQQEIADLTAEDEPDVISDRALGDAEESLVVVPAGDRALGEKPVEDPRLAEARAELERLTVKANEMWEQYAADVEVWQLRKLEESELVAIKDEIGEPPAEPRGLSKNAKPQAVTAYTKRFDAWYLAMQNYTTRYNLHCIAKATVRVTVQGANRGTVTPAQMERLHERPGGRQHVLELIAVLEQLSTEGVDIVAPHRAGA